MPAYFSTSLDRGEVIEAGFRTNVSEPRNRISATNNTDVSGEASQKAKTALAVAAKTTGTEQSVRG